ncbi:MAG: hypothetical protein A2297_05345 [Elusimicrobia bacterium RIFOXYB2_FULL_48_7]|nr:MAG: hypothetical protein A2297_05345 [Elusimicrobia bacterium RIFOXYB2_FULL_48_7]
MNASIDIKGSPSFNSFTLNEAKMNARLENNNLAITGGLLDSSAGTLEWTARVNFTLSRKKFKARGNLNILKSEFAGVTIDSSVIFASFENNTFTINKAELFTESGNISFSGYAGKAGSAGLLNDLFLSYAADINNMGFLKTLAPNLKPVKGSLISSGELRGSGKSLRLTASFEAKNLMYGDAGLYAENSKGALDVMLSSHFPTGNVELSFNGINISGRSFKSLQASISGNEQKMNYRVELIQNPAITYASEGRAVKEKDSYAVNIDKLETSEQSGSGWKNDGNLLVKLSRGRITFDKFQLARNDKQKISVTGALGLKGETDLILKTESVDLAGFNELALPDFKLEGKLNSEIALKGPMVNPSLNGSIEIAGGAFSLPKTGGEYRNIRCRLILKEKEITIDYFDCKNGDEYLDLTGNITAENLKIRNIGLNLACRNFPFASAGFFSARADCQLKLKGSAGDSLLTGNITILKSDIYLSSSRNNQLNEIEVVEKGAKSKTPAPEVKHEPGIISNMSMDIDAAIPGNSWFHWDEAGLDTEIKGNINVKKTWNNPFVISGEIDTSHGSFKYLGKSFTIDEGSLIFTGGNPGDAQLNVKSSKQYPGILVTIAVTGKLSSPQLTLTSIPDTDQADIISYLMFGKPSSKLSQAEEGSLASVPLNVLGTIASQSLKDALGSQLAPEVIEINPVSGGTIGVGKYITNKMFVKQEWAFSSEETYQTIIDYQLDNNFNLHSQSGNSRTAGVDIFWNYSY